MSNMNLTIKPLTWVKGLFTCSSASTILGGSYEIAADDGGAWYFWQKHLPHRKHGPFESEESAKAAVHSHLTSAVCSIAAVGPTADEPVTLTYTNWRGETAARTIIPLGVWFGATEWHQEPQWLLTAMDVEKGAERDFALKDFGQPVAPLSTAARDVLDERARQISAEGWRPEHDDGHMTGELALAGACYALASTFGQDNHAVTAVLHLWPWDRAWLKPTTPRRDLEKAGALILAEIDRRDRAAAKEGAAS